MKTNFKFKVGQRGIAKNGLTAPIVACAVMEGGIHYWLRNSYAEEWVPEKELKLAPGEKAPEEETTDEKSEDKSPPAETPPDKE